MNENRVRGRLSRLDTALHPGGFDGAHDNGPFTPQAINRPSEKGYTSASPTTYSAPLDVTEHVPRQLETRKHQESRKLLYQVLIQLSNRTKPPSASDTVPRFTQEVPETGIGAFAETLKDAVRRGNKQYTLKPEHHGQMDEDGSDNDADDFSTDETIDLMLQLKDVLAMAATEGWNIFEDSPTTQNEHEDEGSRLYSTFRKSRHSFRAVSQRSRSMSPSKGSVRLSEVLSLCVAVLASVVTDDCRYRVAGPRPSRPQNTLQFLTLSVAQFIIHTHRHSPQIISQIASAMIPAFYTFAPQMYIRLLGFFETSILRISLLALESIRARPSLEANIPTTDISQQNLSPAEQDAPVVSIQIEEPPEEMSSLSLTAESSRYRVQSTNNPGLPQNTYHLACLIPPLINAILGSCGGLSATTSDLQLSETRRFLRILAESKLDAYNDLLEVVAYGGPNARRQALGFLASIWPKSVGHTVVSDSLTRKDPPDMTPTRLDQEEDPHQFMPWFFNADVQTTPSLHTSCRSCGHVIQGYCLLCICCWTAVHYDCYDYPPGNYEVQYSTQSEPGLQRVAVCRLSTIKVNGPASPPLASHIHHSLKAANWFTLSLCMECHEPLWGSIGQGLKCEQCPLSLHIECATLFDKSQTCPLNAIASDNIIIEWDVLQQSCINYYPMLQYSDQRLNESTYEEIAVFQSVLGSQIKFYDNGIAFGSIVLSHVPHSEGADPDRQPPNFRLHEVFARCSSLLTSGKLEYCSGTQEFLQDTAETNPNRQIMFDWSYLEHVTTAIKSSLHDNIDSSISTSNFLSVQHPPKLVVASPTTESTYASESVSLVDINSVLRRDFGIRSAYALRLMLDHLHHLSYLNRVDGVLIPFRQPELDKDILCVFPLPLGLDLSVNVEILVSAIEGCLSDLDLTVNEFGLLLVTKRFWPNRLVSEYALKRLSGKILSWILAEDDDLALTLREFVAKHRRIPGVKFNRSPATWPAPPGSRLNPNDLTSNGGDFISARRQLIARYALPWLLNLHHLDSGLYADILFAACLETATENGENAHTLLSTTDGNSVMSSRCDDVLRFIIKLFDYGIVFSNRDSLFIRWIDLVLRLNVSEEALPSLHRLLSREIEPSYVGPTRTTDTTTTGNPDTLQTAFVDPLGLLVSTAGQCEAALVRTLSFFSIMIKSGVDLPITVFQKLMSTIHESHSSFDTANSFVKLMTFSLWLRTSKRQEFQNLISSMHLHFAARISDTLNSGGDSSTALSFIRWSFAACLRIYGCDRSSILNAEIIDRHEVEQLPSRRKLNAQESGVDDPIYIDPEFLATLDVYLQSNVDDVTCLLAKFLNMFLTESPFLESFEADNFILRNGKFVASCAWAAYDIQRDDISIVRTNLILRSLLVDLEPFHDIMYTTMEPNITLIQQRLTGVKRLFRIILDVTSPAFDIEGRQWRSCVIEIFRYYFSAMWADPNEEIRTAVKVTSAALLAAHFDIISQCWSEALSRAPIEERTKLVAFLIQLRPHFPTWKVLSWESMVDSLSESDYAHGADSDGNQNERSSTDPDMMQLKVSTILIGLQMIADGIEIDPFSLMKMKFQFVTIVGFNNVSFTRSLGQHSFNLQFTDSAEITESSFPCIEELAHIIDSPHRSRVPRSALGVFEYRDGDAVDVFIGWTFLDTLLCMITTVRSLTALPVVTLKILLEALYIAMHKCDFGSEHLHHLQPLLHKAVIRSVGLLTENTSFELRQLALSIAQVSIKKWHAFLGAGIPNIIEFVVNDISSQARYSQDSLVVQGKLLTVDALQTFCNNGLLFTLFKRPLKPGFFSVLNQIFLQDKEGALCEGLLRNTMLRTADYCDIQSFGTVLRNIMYFVEAVYSQGYSPELMTYTGQQLVAFARRMSDGTSEFMDPTPLLQICTILIKNNKKSYKELMVYLETILRMSLNRLRVDEEALMNLIQATTSVHPKFRDTGPGSVDVVTILCDVLLDGFRLKTKMQPLTIKAVIGCLISIDKTVAPSASHLPVFYNMVDDAHNFLQNNAWNEENIDWDFQAATAAARLLLRATNRDPASFQRFTEPSFDKGPKFHLTLRSWNVILLVTLREMQADWKAMVYSQFSSFSSSYSAVLRGYVSSGMASATTATNDMNQAHIAVRLWLMLANSMPGLIQSNESIINTVWNELWPPYEGFLSVLEGEARVGLYPALISLASTSAADILLYLRSLKTPLGLDSSAHIAILSKIASLNRGDATSNKIARAMTAMTEPPPELSSSVFLDQIAKELVATEKLRLIELNGSLRYAGDKTRKDGRSGTS